MSAAAIIPTTHEGTIGRRCPDEVVYLVHDDTPIRAAVDRLLSSSEFRVRSFGSAAAYVAAARPAAAACLVLGGDVRDVDRLDPERGLSIGPSLPIVFITGRLVSSVRPSGGGAVDFLVRPLSESAIVQAVETALAIDREARHEAAGTDRLRRRYGSLTPRQREVLPLIASGLLNKQAAAELGISLVTLQIHRRNVMRKMAARSLAELVRMAAKLAIPVRDVDQ